MGNHLKKIKELLAESAVHIDKYGHHQNDMWEGMSCCIMGAPRMIDNESSYSHISRHVLVSMGYGPNWANLVEIISDVDNWDQSTYTDMEAKNSIPTNIDVDDVYTKALASFLGTVMTSGKTTNSTPFKNYFDKTYKELK